MPTWPNEVSATWLGPLVWARTSGYERYCKFDESHPIISAPADLQITLRRVMGTNEKHQAKNNSYRHKVVEVKWSPSVSPPHRLAAAPPPPPHCILMDDLPADGVSPAKWCYTYDQNAQYVRFGILEGRLILSLENTSRLRNSVVSANESAARGS
ncbi:hypothetical protein J6590_033690 [Homalodisca vitripennis]|nr:hypothetical protein J6590_033690 [Homalodisca vitripennis]